MCYTCQTILKLHLENKYLPKVKEKLNTFYCGTKYVLKPFMTANENNSNEKYKTKF